MMHKGRVHQLVLVNTLDELVREITRTTWTSCTGFYYGGLLLLNDCTGPDGAQEYAIVDPSKGVQVESLTISWMKPEKFREVMCDLIDQKAKGELEIMSIGPFLWEMAPDHKCHLCA